MSTPEIQLIKEAIAEQNERGCLGADADVLHAAFMQAIDEAWGAFQRCAKDGDEYHAYTNRHPVGTTFKCKKCGKTFKP